MEAATRTFLTPLSHVSELKDKQKMKIWVALGIFQLLYTIYSCFVYMYLNKNFLWKTFCQSAATRFLARLRNGRCCKGHLTAKILVIETNDPENWRRKGMGPRCNTI